MEAEIMTPAVAENSKGGGGAHCPFFFFPEHANFLTFSQLIVTEPKATEEETPAAEVGLGVKVHNGKW